MLAMTEEDETTCFERLDALPSTRGTIEVRGEAHWWFAWIGRNSPVHLPAAKRDLLEHLAHHPNDFDALVRAAWCCMHRDALPEALPLLDRAAALRPRDLHLLDVRALSAQLEASHLGGDRMAEYRERHARIASELEDVLREEPESVALLARLSMSLFALGERDRASRALERALAINPDHTDCLTRLALACRESDPALARRSIDRAIQLAPRNGYYFYVRADLIGETDRPGVIADYERALEFGAPGVDRAEVERRLEELRR